MMHLKNTTNHKEINMAVTREQVTELYVATFDRAPDSAGLDYWINSGLSIEEIAQSFFDQPETQAKYPAGMSDAQFINAIYLNMFNRPADPDGLAYWANELATESITKGNMILAIANGAQDTALGMDDTILANKTAVGLDFAAAGLDNVANAIDVMANVDETQASVDAAMAQIDAWQTVNDRHDYTLEEDHLQGTTGDDLFRGVLDDRTAAEDRSTFESRDTADGRDGHDTVQVVNVGTNAVNMIVQMENIEVFDIEESGAATATYHMQNVAGLEKIIMRDFNGLTDTFNDLQNIVSVDMLSDTIATTLNVNYSGATISGTNDSMDLSVTSNDPFTADLFITNGIEHINLTVTGNNLLAIVDPSMQTLTIDGSGNLTLDNTIVGFTFPSVIDATAMTGNFQNAFLVQPINPGFGMDIRSGSGDDTLIGTNDGDTLVGNAGEDTIYGFGGNDRIAGGTGKDELWGGTGSDSFYFSAGDSSLSQIAADTIADFANTVDFIDLRVSGTTVNTVNGQATYGLTSESFAQALGSADFYMDGTVKYYIADVGAFDTYLFIDNDMDGNADEVIKMLSTNATTFTSGNII